MYSKKACLGVSLWGKSCKILVWGCFSFRGEITIRVFFWKPLVTHVYNTSIWVVPRSVILLFNSVSNKIRNCTENSVYIYSVLTLLKEHWIKGFNKNNWNTYFFLLYDCKMKSNCFMLYEHLENCFSFILIPGFLLNNKDELRLAPFCASLTYLIIDE